MPYQLTQTDTGLEIEISETGEHGPDLLTAFQACQEGRCSCPTDEYEKLASLDVVADQDTVQLSLKPVDGTRFNPDEIAACLDFTLASAGMKT